jgi:RimJ/RimL family protein N-acetyltransferase
MRASSETDPSYSFDPRLLDRPCAAKLAGVRLRALEAADAVAMAEGLSDLDVAQNLIAVPHPYTIDDARGFLTGPGASPHMLAAAIEVEGVFAGSVSIDAQGGRPELGYWLAKPFWGRGIGQAAARAHVDLVFSATDLDALVSGHFVDNAASAAILAKLGFRRTGLIETRSRARPEPVRLVAMALDRSEWVAGQPLVETARLAMRPPTTADADEIALLSADPTLGLMTAAIPKPFTLEDARAFVLGSARRRRPASMTFSIRRRETGDLIGGIGWSEGQGGEIELGYWLGAEHRGRGLATEAARAVLDAAFEMTAATAATARCRVTNPASRGVLERCGFQWESAGFVRSPGAAGSVAVDVFRLDRDVFLSLKEWGLSARSNAAVHVP